MFSSRHLFFISISPFSLDSFSSPDPSQAPQSEEKNQPVSGATYQLLRELRRTVTHSTVIAHPAKKHCVFDFKDLCDPEDDQQQSCNELTECQPEWEWEREEMGITNGNGKGMGIKLG